MDREVGSRSTRIAKALVKRWPLLVIIPMGLLVMGAVLAPTLMALGAATPGRFLYVVYSFQCHQLPQRSYFLFGPQLVQTYSWDQLLGAGMDRDQPRQFLGAAHMGYKLGLAHRNTALYSSLLAGSVVFALLRGRITWRLSLRGYLLSWFLLALDGGSHLVSELTGWGFRATNEWLAVLSAHAFPAHFYSGTGIASFNWLMRTLTGTIVGLSTIWFVFPFLQKGFERERVAREGEVTGKKVAATTATHGPLPTLD